MLHRMYDYLHDLITVNLPIYFPFFDTALIIITYKYNNLSLLNSILLQHFWPCGQYVLITVLGNNGTHKGSLPWFSVSLNLARLTLNNFLFLSFDTDNVWYFY